MNLIFIQRQNWKRGLLYGSKRNWNPVYLKMILKYHFSMWSLDSLINFQRICTDISRRPAVVGGIIPHRIFWNVHIVDFFLFLLFYLEINSFVCSVNVTFNHFVKSDKDSFSSWWTMFKIVSLFIFSFWRVFDRTGCDIAFKRLLKPFFFFFKSCASIARSVSAFFSPILFYFFFNSFFMPFKKW